MAFACTAAWAYRSRSRLFFGAWCIAVSASAWLIWEHHVIDLAGGAALAVICIAWIYLPLQNREKRRFAFKIDEPGVYDTSKPTSTVTSPPVDLTLQTTMTYVTSPLATISGTAQDTLAATPNVQVEIHDLDATPVDEFMSGQSWLFEELRRLDADEKFVALVHEMRRDRERVLGRARWNSEEIDEHLRRTFHLSVELMLILTGSKARAGDVPALIEALAWCSTF